MNTFIDRFAIIIRDKSDFTSPAPPTQFKETRGGQNRSTVTKLLPHQSAITPVKFSATIPAKFGYTIFQPQQNSLPQSPRDLVTQVTDEPLLTNGVRTPKS